MLGERLAECRRRAGLTQTELAVAIGKRYNAPMISMVEHGQRGLAFDGVVGAARELRVSIDYLAGLTDDPTPAAELAAALAERETPDFDRELAISQEPEPGDLPPWRAASKPLKKSRWVRVPFMDSDRAAAGPGEPDLGDSEEMAVLLAERVVESWARPERLRCVQVVGSSMLPAIHSGDLVAVDQGRREPIEGQVFVIRTDEGRVIKRLCRIGGRWSMVSDNPAFRPRPVAEGDRILGQVAWTGPPGDERERREARDQEGDA